MRMIDYAGFGYSPDYGFKLYRNGELIYEEAKVDYAACFSRAFGKLTGTQNHYLGIYTLRCRKKFRRGSGNYCTLDKSQILIILRYMRRVFNIKIHFTETDDNYVFVFTIEGKPIKHKFILTFSRVFFEFPYNELAKDVLKLRAKGIVGGVDYSHKGFFELFYIISMTHYDGWGLGHSLFAGPVLDPDVHIAKKQFEIGLSRVHEVYGWDEDLQRKLKHYETVRDGVEWSENFPKRALKYSENFKILRKLKHNEKGIRRRARKAL